MTVQPDVSVIIPVHNAGATVGRLVAAVLAVPELVVEVVAVDDASTDDSLAQLDRLASPALVVERFARNAGAGVARWARELRELRRREPGGEEGLEAFNAREQRLTAELGLAPAAGPADLAILRPPDCRYSCTAMRVGSGSPAASRVASMARPYGRQLRCG